MNKENNQNRSHWRIVVLIVVLVVISLIFFQFVFAGETSDKKKCEDDELLVLYTMLAKIPNSKVTAKSLIEGKIRMYETMATLCETITPATIDPKRTMVFPTGLQKPFATGIFKGQPGAFFHSFEAIIENHWRGIVNGEPVFVLAGAWVSDPNQGFIAVRSNHRRSQSLNGLFPSETKSGALRIIGAEGTRLIVQQTNDEKILYFDVPSLSYVSSLDEVVRGTTTPSPNPLSTNISPYPAP